MTTDSTSTDNTTTGSATADSTSTPPPTVWPTLRARDARAMIRFLVEGFGFTEVVAWGDQPDGGGEFVVHAQLAWPLGGGIMLGSARPADADDAWPQQPGTFAAYVVCDEPDALFEKAVAAGAAVLQGLHDTDYGSRDFSVRDPEGNLWAFGTYRGEPRPA